MKLTRTEQQEMVSLQNFGKQQGMPEVMLVPGEPVDGIKWPRSVLGDQKVFIDRILDNPLEPGFQNKIIVFRYYEPMYCEFEFQAAKMSDFMASNNGKIFTIPTPKRPIPIVMPNDPPTKR